MRTYESLIELIDWVISVRYYSEFQNLDLGQNGGCADEWLKVLDSRDWQMIKRFSFAGWQITDEQLSVIASKKWPNL